MTPRQIRTATDKALAARLAWLAQQSRRLTITVPEFDRNEREVRRIQDEQFDRAVIAQQIRKDIALLKPHYCKLL